VALLLVLLVGEAAWAQDKPTLSGSWSASALTERWSVVEWGEACGPRPSPQGAGGGAVQIREQGGELSIVGAGRAFSTAECWEQLPGVARSSHSQSGGGRSWRTRCTSAPNDSRRTAITTSISATDSTLVLSEVGDYAFTIKDTNCHATVSRSRSFALLHRDGEAPPIAPASPAPTAPATATAAPVREPRPSSRCAGAAGDPARLEVRPARKLVRAGDKLTFRASVLDAEGCATGPRPTWLVAPGPLASKATIDAIGTLTVDADAPEGTLDVTATVAEKGVTVHVDVATPEHYDAMLAGSGLDDAGEADQPAVAVIASGTVGGRVAAAQDAGRERKTAFVAAVVGVALVLAFAGLVLVRRGSRPAEVEDEEAGPRSRTPASVPAPASARAPEAAPDPAAKRPRGKICPTCGERYPNEAGFCGKDATKLVLLN
jgi:hypothetical protein